MSKIYEAVEKRMPDGTLAYGFHRTLLVDDNPNPFGAWVCQDCGKRWQARPNCFNAIREDKICNE